MGRLNSVEKENDMESGVDSEGGEKAGEEGGQRVWEIESMWWFWDEEEEVLRDGRGNNIRRIQGRGKEERTEKDTKEMGRKGEREGEKETGEKKGWRIGFWNVAGLRGKYREIWEIRVLMETWIDEKRWRLWGTDCRWDIGGVYTVSGEEI